MKKDYVWGEGHEERLCIGGRACRKTMYRGKGLVLFTVILIVTLALTPGSSNGGK